MASASKSGEILLHSLVTCKRTASLNAGQCINDICFHPKENNLHLLATGSVGGRVQVWDGTKKKQIWDTNTLKSAISGGNHPFQKHASDVTQVRFSNGNSPLLFSSGLDGHISFYDYTNKRGTYTLKVNYEITCFDFSIDKKSLSIGTSAGDVLLYNLVHMDKGGLLMTLQYTIKGAHNCRVHDVQYMPNTQTKWGNSSSSNDPVSKTSVLQKRMQENRERDRKSQRSAVPFHSPPSTHSPITSSRASPSSSREIKGATKDLIKEAVEEGMAEFREAQREDMQNLHLELLRQFHTQQTEMRELLEGFTKKYEAVVGEVKQLRDDYERMKHIY